MKRDSQYPKEEVTAEEALLDAGFAPRTASILASANRWLFPFTITVSIVALLWIGFHLWPDLDAAAWQQWADENAGFFAPLSDGSTVGILPEVHGHMGLLLTKGPAGIEVERRLWFPFDEVPVGLVVVPEAAELWLGLDFDDPSFWSDWQEIAEHQGINLYQHLRRGSPRAPGYRAFIAQLHEAGAD